MRKRARRCCEEIVKYQRLRMLACRRRAVQLLRCDMLSNLIRLWWPELLVLMIQRCPHAHMRTHMHTHTTAPVPRNSSCTIQTCARHMYLPQSCRNRSKCMRAYTTTHTHQNKYAQGKMHAQFVKKRRALFTTPTNRTAIGKAVPQPYAHCRNWLQNEIPHLGERRSPTYYKIHSFLNAPLRFQSHMRNAGTVLKRNMKRNTNTQIQMTKAETDRIAKCAHNRGTGVEC